MNDSLEAFKAYCQEIDKTAMQYTDEQIAEAQEEAYKKVMLQLSVDAYLSGHEAGRKQPDLFTRLKNMFKRR